MALRVGTSGWQYADWRGAFYPPRLATAAWLEHYAEAFATVEVNNTFYRLPAPGTLGRWAAATPPDFCFAVKASRYLTHMKRLLDPEDPVRRLLERAQELGSKLGPVLVQLPPTMRRDTGRLADLLAVFGGRARIVFEPRHDSWHDDAVYELLATHDAALCWWDRLGRHGPLVRTASWVYVRLHEGRARPEPCYGLGAIKTWCGRVAEHFGSRADGYLYFNNDHCACAPRNAAQLSHAARDLGIDVTRSPARLPPTAAA